MFGNRGPRVIGSVFRFAATASRINLEIRIVCTRSLPSLKQVEDAWATPEGASLYYRDQAAETEYKHFDFSQQTNVEVFNPFLAVCLQGFLEEKGLQAVLGDAMLSFLLIAKGCA